MIQRDWTYMVVERYYDDGGITANVIPRDQFKESDHPEKPEEYDQYFTPCADLKEAQQVQKIAAMLLP